MTELLRFAAVGIGSGAIIALAALGVVQVYRGSGVLNFAQGAIALASAMVAYRVHDAGFPRPVSLAVGAIAGGVLGLVVHVAVMRPLRHSSQLVRIIATIGVLTVLQSLVQIVFETELTSARIVPSYFPSTAWEPIGSVVITYDRLILSGIAVLLTILLAVFSRCTRFGIATEAAAENAQASRALGYSPNMLGAVNWTAGGILAGIAGSLLLPISGLVAAPLVLLVVPALAAALLGGFRWYGITTLAAFSIGSGQSLLTQYGAKWGWPGGLPSALPFILIIVVLAARGTAIPRRDEVRARLPRVARTPPRPIIVVGVLVAGGALAATSSDRLANIIITTATFAIVALSLVVITGLTGQVSLGQFALAGFGALVAARMNFSNGLPFPVAAVIGIAAAAVLGLVFALPSLRARGPALAVATIGMALAIERLILGDQRWTAGLTGTPVEPPTLLGWEIDATSHPQRYALVCTLTLVSLSAVIANLRSGAVGRRLLAVRSNERAASAVGIEVARTKVAAFALAATIAGFGGVLMGFRFATVQYSQFGFFASIQVVTTGLVGGIGYLTGALIAGLQVPSGVVTYLTEHLANADQWVVLLSGVGLIATLISYPDGLARAATNAARRRRSTARADSERVAVVSPATAPRPLEVRDLTVRYGGVVAVNGVSFDVLPGRITALIGANGAGKTSAIDAITGFTTATGSVRLGDDELLTLRAHARSRLGLARAFQSVELFDDLTVRENVLLAAERRSWRQWVTAAFGRSASGLPHELLEIVRQLGLEDHLDKLPDELSHGARRLVGVGRALAQRPSVLLLDEPAAGLDRNETRELGALLRRIADTTGVGIMLVEHDVGLVTEISDDVVALDFGSTIFTGLPSAVRTDPAIRRAYLGLPAEQPGELSASLA